MKKPFPFTDYLPAARKLENARSKHGTAWADSVLVSYLPMHKLGGMVHDIQARDLPAFMAALDAGPSPLLVAADTPQQDPATPRPLTRH